MTASPTLLWFRRDLRLSDNPALAAAAARGPVLALYIDEEGDGPHAAGAASRWWLHHSLASLNESTGGCLHVRKGNAADILPRLAKEHGIKRVFWNRRYEPRQLERDREVKTLLESAAVECRSYQASLLWEPWTVSKQDGSPYRVFTPFYRKGCLQQAAPRLPLPAPDSVQWARLAELPSGPNRLGLLPAIPWDQGMEACWTPGEQGASRQLAGFLQQSLESYGQNRDRPDLPGTSRLSPHLRFGELSANQAWYAALDHGQNPGHSDQGLNKFQSELGWREFSYYLLYHFPGLPEDNFNAKFDAFPWRDDPAGLKRWQQGQTGVPLVDAGMRELWHTGYMHNRVRMVAASFLVKNLLIDWRHGARWFQDCLVDFDLASNSASWQWVAGSGADAAPFFRIFNPVLQGEKFDSAGDYTRRWCPELEAIPDRWLQQPWSAPGLNWPAPIVDLKGSRERALQAYKALS